MSETEVPVEVPDVQVVVEFRMGPGDHLQKAFAASHEWHRGRLELKGVIEVVNGHPLEHCRILPWMDIATTAWPKVRPFKAGEKEQELRILQNGLEMLRRSQKSR